MIFLFFLALILFGPKKLPEIGRQIGRMMNEFRRASNEFRSQIESEINSLETQSKPQILPSIQAPLGSIASRILNPPAEQLRVAGNRAAETDTAAKGGEIRDAEVKPAVVAQDDPGPATASHPKVAPDA